MTLTAFIDDSEQGNVLVYAGYVARLSDWETFRQQWQDCLNADPRLGYFKMSEAMARRGAWERCAEIERNHRVREFYKIVAANVLGGVSVILPLDLFKEVWCADASIPSQAKNKHFFITQNVMHDLLRFSEELGLDEPIDFVVDNRAHGQDQIFNAWLGFTKNAPIQKHRFGSSPRFEDDKTTLPLQAADLGAWIVRRNAVKLLAREPEETFPWSDVKITHKRINRVWDREMFAQHSMRGKIKSFTLRIGGENY